jgi:hypothetical protein
VTGPRGEKFSDLRNNRHVAKRGGWTRVLILVLIGLLLVSGLAVGLGVGLTKSNQSERYLIAKPLSTSVAHFNLYSTASPSPQATTAPFPAGSYAFDTYLSTVSTNCTPNSNTWRCYPYVTYSEAGSGADATFNWIITPATESETDYVISSTNDPFALDFSNATLSLTNIGQSSEAYRFSVNMRKTVIPNVTLTADGASTDCFYNGAIFSAVLYTKKAKTYPAQYQTPQSATGAYTPWPYAVEVQQVANGGAGVPDCYKMINGNTGEHVPIGTEPDTQTCECRYQNYGT